MASGDFHVRFLLLNELDEPKMKNKKLLRNFSDKNSTHFKTFRCYWQYKQREAKRYHLSRSINGESLNEEIAEVRAPPKVHVHVHFTYIACYCCCSWLVIFSFVTPRLIYNEITGLSWEKKTEFIFFFISLGWRNIWALSMCGLNWVVRRWKKYQSCEK